MPPSLRFCPDLEMQFPRKSDHKATISNTGKIEQHIHMQHTDERSLHILDTAHSIDPSDIAIDWSRVIFTQTQPVGILRPGTAFEFWTPSMTSTMPLDLCMYLYDNAVLDYINIQSTSQGFYPLLRCLHPGHHTRSSCPIPFFTAHSKSERHHLTYIH
jgi:hypothetical protein